MIAAELRLTKTMPTYFSKKHNLLYATMLADVKFYNLNIKIRSVFMVYCIVIESNFSLLPICTFLQTSYFGKARNIAENKIFI